MTVPDSSAQPPGSEPGAPLRRLFWRIHFWAGLLSAPIVPFAAATGLLYALSPQVEAWRHARVDRVPVGTAMQSLDAQVAAVRAAFAQQPVRYVVPAFAPGDTTQVYLALDAWSGEPLFRAGWSDLPVLARATAAGIPFHRGEFGTWNQALLVLAALAAGFSVLSGLWMWWLRRPHGRTHGRVGAPPVQAAQWRAAPRWLWPVALGLAVAMPVFGWSLLLLALLEAGRLGLAARRPSFS